MIPWVIIEYYFNGTIKLLKKRKKSCRRLVVYTNRVINRKIIVMIAYTYIYSKYDSEFVYILRNRLNKYENMQLFSSQRIYININTCLDSVACAEMLWRDVINQNNENLYYHIITKQSFVIGAWYDARTQQYYL